MNVVLALFIALTAGASEEANRSVPETTCAAHASKYPETLNQIAESLRKVGVKPLLRSIDDGSLEVVSGKSVSTNWWGARRVLKLGDIPFETEIERNRATRAVARALFRLERAGRTPTEVGHLQTDMGIVAREFPVPRQPISTRRNLVRAAIGVGTVVAIAGGSVIYSAELSSAYRAAVTEVSKLNPWGLNSGPQSETERRVRELEAAINSETDRLYGPNQEKIARDKAELSDLLQKHPEIRRGAGR